MKTKLLSFRCINALLPVIFSLIYYHAQSQTIKVKEPQWEGEVVFVSDTSLSSVPLERQTGSVKAKADASMFIVGLGKVSSWLYVNGETSNVRFKQAPKHQFLYRSSNNSLDPKTFLRIIKMERVKDARRIGISSVGVFTGSENGNIKYLDFTAEKYGKSSYLITLSNYENGEYAFNVGLQLTHNLHLFGIGAVDSNLKIQPSVVDKIITPNSEPNLSSRKGRSFISGLIGAQISGPLMFGVEYEYAILDKLTIGEGYMYGKKEEGLLAIATSTQHMFTLKPAYHFFSGFGKTDLYAGARVGIRSIQFDYMDIKQPVFAPMGGVRYFVAPSIALNAEIAIGSPMLYFGLTFSPAIKVK